MINIRLAAEEDLGFWSSVDGHATHENIKRRISEKRGFIILNGNKPAGVIAFNMFWDELPFLSLIKISPEYRRLGIGTEAIRLFETELKKLGYKALLVSTQTDENAQHFYRKAGYRECGCLILDEEPFKQTMEMFFIKSF